MIGEIDRLKAALDAAQNHRDQLFDAIAEYIDAVTDPTGTEIEPGDVRSRTGRAWERLCILGMRSNVLYGPATPPQNP